MRIDSSAAIRQYAAGRRPRRIGGHARPLFDPFHLAAASRDDTKVERSVRQSLERDLFSVWRKGGIDAVRHESFAWRCGASSQNAESNYGRTRGHSPGNVFSHVSLPCHLMVIMVPGSCPSRTRISPLPARTLLTAVEPFVAEYVPASRARLPIVSVLNGIWPS